MLVAILIACTPTDEKDTGEPPPLALDDTGGCSSVPPVVDSFTIGNGGLITGDSGEQPSVLLAIQFHDDDMDADYINLSYWWDETVDGTVDTSGAPAMESGAFKFDQDGEPCRVSGGTFEQRIGVTGNPFTANTRYDFAVTVTDHGGLTSDPAFATGVTPKEDGSDGDAR